MNISFGKFSLNLKAIQTFKEIPEFEQSFKTQSLECALKSPIGLPQIEKCVTPDDKVTIAIDPCILNRGFRLSALLSALANAGIDEFQVTILLPCFASDSQVEQLKEISGGCAICRHNSEDLLNKSIIGSTRDGENVYLNRNLVEADFLIIACGTQQIDKENSPASLIFKGMSYFVPNGSKSESLTLLGSPFLVMHVNGPTEAESHWVSGNMEAFRTARSLRRRFWTHHVFLPADLIILDLQNIRKPISFFELVQLTSRMISVLDNGGRIVLIGDQIIEETGFSHLASWVLPNPDSYEVKRLADQNIKAMRLWSTIITKAAVYLYQVLPFDACEDLQANSISNINEIQRLIEISNHILLIRNPLMCVLKQSW